MGRVDRKDYAVDSIDIIVWLWLLLLLLLVVDGINKYIHIYWLCIGSDSIFIIIEGISRILYQVVVVSLPVLIKSYCDSYYYTVSHN